VNDPDPPRDADVVVGDDSELTRMLKGGAADPIQVLNLKP